MRKKTGLHNWKFVFKACLLCMYRFQKNTMDMCSCFKMRKQTWGLLNRKFVQVLIPKKQWACGVVSRWSKNCATASKAVRQFAIVVLMRGTKTDQYRAWIPLEREVKNLTNDFENISLSTCTRRPNEAKRFVPISRPWPKWEALFCYSNCC